MRDKIICGFLQEKLLNFKGTRYETRKKEVDGKEISYKKEIEIKLDIIDAHILQKVSKFMMNPRGNSMFNNRIFTIIKYDIIIENLPLLNLTKKGLRERFKKYRILGALEMKMEKHPNFGTKTYYSLTEELYKCIDGYIDESEVEKESLLTGSKEKLLTVSEEKLLTVSEKHYKKHSKNTTKETSSSFLEILFKKHNFEVSTLNIINIEKLNLQESRIEELLKYTILKKKKIGYLIKALKENWDISTTKEPREPRESRSTKVLGETHKFNKSGLLVEINSKEQSKPIETKLSRLRGAISRKLLKTQNWILFEKFNIVTTIETAIEFIKTYNLNIDATAILNEA